MEIMYNYNFETIPLLVFWYDLLKSFWIYKAAQILSVGIRKHKNF